MSALETTTRTCARRLTRTPRRAGLSLLELLLVLALLVAIAAMAMPAVGITMDKHQLRNAGELVRMHWAKGRVQAMDEGRTYLFRYEVEGNTFSLEPWVSDEDYLESSDIGAYGGAATGMMPPSTGVTSPGNALASPTAIVKSMEDGIRFVGSEIAVDSRSMLNDQLTGAVNDMSLSPPIYFYPDGTTSTARVVIVNQRDRYITISIRGLTGMVKVSDIQSALEVMR